MEKTNKHEWFNAVITAVGYWCIFFAGYIIAIYKFNPGVLWYNPFFALFVLLILGIAQIGIGYHFFYKQYGVK